MKVEKVIAECMKSLKFATILEYSPKVETVDGMWFLRVQQIYGAMEKHGALAVVLDGGARELIDNAEIVQMYGPWVQQVL